LQCLTENAPSPNTSTSAPPPNATNARPMATQHSTAPPATTPVLYVPNPTPRRITPVRSQTAEQDTHATTCRYAVPTVYNHTKQPTETALPMSKSHWACAATWPPPRIRRWPSREYQEGIGIALPPLLPFILLQKFPSMMYLQNRWDFGPTEEAVCWAPLYGRSLGHFVSFHFRLVEFSFALFCFSAVTGKDGNPTGVVR